MKFSKLHLGETIIIAKMSYDEALKTLDLTKAPDADTLKQAFRKAALKHHPDRGGDAETFKKVNEANDVLQGTGAGNWESGKWSSQDRQAEHAARDEKFRKAAEVVIAQLKQDFKPEVFDKYFEEKTNKKYTYKVTWNEGTKGDRFAFHNVGVRVEWLADDKNTAFSLQAYVDMISVVYPKPSLGGGLDYDAIGYDMMVITDIFHNNRKVKFTQKNYQRSQLKSLLTNPESLFPSKKMAAMMGGKDNARKFSKRDMFLGIAKKLGGRVTEGTQPWAFIPMGKGFKFAMHRYVFMGRMRDTTALWMPSEVDNIETRKSIRVKALTLVESEDLLDALFRLQKHLENETDAEKIKTEIELELSKLAVKSATAFATLKLGEKMLVKAWKEDLAPQIILLMGLPAAGKSTFVKNELIKYYNHKMPHLSGFQTLNSDNQLQKYQWMQATEDFKNLSTAEPATWDAVTKPLTYKSNEGDDINFKLSYEDFKKFKNFDAFYKAMYKDYYATYFGQRAAAKKDTDALMTHKVKAGDVIILDSTGTDTAKFLKVFQQAKEQGSTTSVIWLDIPVAYAVGRDNLRRVTLGRYVGEKVIRTYAPAMQPAYQKYTTRDDVDRTLKFKWVGEVGAGKYQLVHDHKKYPKKQRSC